MDCFVCSTDLADLVEAWLVGFASGCGPVLSLGGVKSRVQRKSNLIFGGTGVSPVILTDRLEACPTMEIASGWRPRNDISRHVAFSNGAKGTIHYKRYCLELCSGLNISQVVRTIEPLMIRLHLARCVDPAPNKARSK